MSRTIDVDSESGWPPKKRPTKRGKNRENVTVSPATMVFGLFVGLMLVGGLFLAFTGKLGVVNISDQEIGVKVNYMTGEREVFTTPGYKIFIPFVQEVYPLDRTSQKFTMQGTKAKGRVAPETGLVPRLTVRASDGSNFWFDTLEIQYEIIPEKADYLLDDSGPGDAFKVDWVKGYARSVLRDEFGKYSAIEAADPTTYSNASIEGRRRLNEFLEPHGIRVTRIVTPKPKFDPQYEAAIEERKEADQDVERLIAKEEQLAQERAQRLAAVAKDKEIEMQELTGELKRQLLESERDAIRVKKAADEYAIQRQAGGEALKQQRIAEARGLEAKYTKEAEGLEKQAQALEQRGEVVVREALIEKLLSIRFSLMPYSRDPAPQRLEHEGARPASASFDPGALEGGQ